MEKKELPEDYICELYTKKKLNSIKIAKMYGCCKSTILKILHNKKVKTRLPGVPRLGVTKKRLKKLYLDKKLSTWKIAELLKCGRSTIHRKLKKMGIIRDISKAHIRYKRKPFVNNSIEKAYLIGFAIGDLRVRKVGQKSKTIKVDCGSTRVEQIRLIEKLFSKYGRVWKSEPTKSGKIQIEAFLDESFSFLLNLKDNLKWIINNKGCFLSFLAGFIDAEGSFFITDNQARLSIGNYDHEILSLISKELKRIGIECSEIYNDNLRGYMGSDGYVRSQDYYHIEVRRKTPLFRLIKILQKRLKHEDRRKQLKIAKDNIIIRNKIHGASI